MVNTLGDMFSDCSRYSLSSGKNYHEELVKEGSLIESKLVFKEMRQDWLSENAEVEINFWKYILMEIPNCFNVNSWIKKNFMTFHLSHPNNF
jgi:hypothetical protein